MTIVKKAVLRSFDSETYAAIVEISGSSKVYLEGVAIARNIPSGEMINGRNLAVVFFEEHNVKEAVVVAVF